MARPRTSPDGQKFQGRTGGKDAARTLVVREPQACLRFFRWLNPGPEEADQPQAALGLARACLQHLMLATTRDAKHHSRNRGMILSAVTTAIDFAPRASAGLSAQALQHATGFMRVLQ